MCGPVFATEAFRIGGWRLHGVLDQLFARIGVIDAKDRNVSAELRDTQEYLVIGNAKVTILREEADRYRDRSPPRLAPYSQKMTRPVDRSEREEYDYYDRADCGRDAYREDGPYYGGGLYAPEKLCRPEVYPDRNDP